ncbi:MAG: tol-pal system-associated acyl-CoA thioesterase [Alphaproteobacteria bacterium]|nr:tol-pal system-associated acyl-CoA thioesterase [Alphaproteobacteria bacterium]
MYPLRVYFEDTDAEGVVYYANYLKYAERARSECLRAMGINQKEVMQKERTGFIVRSCQIEYLGSARLEDDLIVTMEVVEVGGASMVLRQSILRGDEVLTLLELKVVNLNLDTHRPARISAEIKEKTKAFTESA